MDMLTDAIRWINFVMGTACLLWLGIRSQRRWAKYPYEIRLFILTLSFFVFGVAYGSAESAVQYVPFGVRTIIFLMANLALLTTLIVTQRERPYEVIP